MNNERRKQIAALLDRIESVCSEVEDLQSEEQDYYDNMPESFQGGEKGENAQAAIDALDSAAQSLREAVEFLGTAQE
ncbi:hypothetical protein [Pseudomonas sp. PS01301]|uniref:hypothetical protein n=1 Tax=Pseudomonas sp. PS01301 TaxID=2991437 RepID=UPI00249B5B8A|nr:hypothetical protein [Pseudomonas sp. PS01301]